jgi:hypothetical protein
MFSFEGWMQIFFRAVKFCKFLVIQPWIRIRIWICIQLKCWIRVQWIQIRNNDFSNISTVWYPYYLKILPCSTVLLYFSICLYCGSAQWMLLPPLPPPTNTFFFSLYAATFFELGKVQPSFNQVDWKEWWEDDGSTCESEDIIECGDVGFSWTKFIITKQHWMQSW